MCEHASGSAGDLKGSQPRLPASSTSMLANLAA